MKVAKYQAVTWRIPNAVVDAAALAEAVASAAAAFEKEMARVVWEMDRAALGVGHAAAALRRMQQEIIQQDQDRFFEKLAEDNARIRTYAPYSAAVLRGDNKPKK